MTSVFINELHYENIGIDALEGVEIAGPAGTKLDGWTIHQYNGGSGKKENTLSLRGVLPNLQNGWGVSFFEFKLANYSHGTGLALVDNKSQVVQFLSYTAPVTAVDGVAGGKIAQLIPVVETVWTSVGHSLQLQGKGNKYEDFKWVGPARSSYGAINHGQIFEPIKHAVIPQPEAPVGGIDLQVEANRLRHHTDKFHGFDMLILRRGEVFVFSLKSSSAFRADHVLLHFKVYPEGNTQIVKVAETDEDDIAGSEFVAFVSGVENGQANISVRIPGNAIVGEYLFSVSLDEGKTWSADSHIVILFNAWSKEDLVFLSDEQQRAEYVLADDGLIWVGNQYSNSGKPWNFAQFNTKSLLATLKLLQLVPVAQRADPVVVSRRMSALVNAQHDNGVLVGNWSSDFSGGTAPTAWAGSAEILKEYVLTGKPVRYAQCWVFSGVLTTVMRALGVPARSVTNFASAHDVPVPNYNRSVDRYFKRGGLEPDENKTRDSVWNFHVWNDVWLARPDLGPEYFGWQTIDATPQELSGGTYQTGPAPLVAIKDGTKDIQYDLEFIYSEVNADENYYVQNDKDSGYTLVRTVTDSVGKSISTKAVGSNKRQDITLDYKYPEGSVEERASHGAADSKTGDVAIRWEVDDQTTIGKVIQAKLILEAKAGVHRTAKIQLVAAVNQYTGKLRKTLAEQQKTVVVGGTPVTLDFSLAPQLYEKNLQVDSSFIFKAFVRVDETDQTSLLLREFNFKNFELQIALPGPVVVGSSPTAVVTFTNPLSFTLTKLILHVEGQGLIKAQKFPLGNLKPGETISHSVVLTVLEKGDHLLIALLDTNEIADVKGFIHVTVQ